MNYTIKENQEWKVLKSEDFNYRFNKKTGYHEQWGKQKKKTQ